MMRKLPNCPKCQEDELRLSRAGDTFWMHCYFCRWQSGIITLATGQDLDETIANVVKSASKPLKGGE